MFNFAKLLAAAMARGPRNYQFKPTANRNIGKRYYPKASRVERRASGFDGRGSKCGKNQWKGCWYTRQLKLGRPVRHAHLFV